MLEPDEYECAACHEVFRYGWSDAEADAEFERRFARQVDSTDAVVCDDCYPKILRANGHRV